MFGFGGICGSVSGAGGRGEWCGDEKASKTEWTKTGMIKINGVLTGSILPQFP